MKKFDRSFVSLYTQGALVFCAFFKYLKFCTDGSEGSLPLRVLKTKQRQKKMAFCASFFEKKRGNEEPFF